MNKEHILREIHRTASHNGGKPLGWRRFAAETGIREADWLGKFWARWGDALQDAGFAPNRLQAAYGKADLLEKYALFAEELGRLPTANDLRMKDRVEPGFPNQKVFERLGTKLDLVRLVRDHCDDTGTFGVTEEEGIHFAADGRSFVTSIGNRQSTAWIRDSRGDRQITSEGFAFFPTVSPDGKKVYYLVRTGGARNFITGGLWAADLDSTARRLPT